MKATTKRKIRKMISPFRRIGLKNKDFSIISNNCWGGFIYDYFGLQYKTPTIGLFFYSDDYIRFLKNLKHYLSCECKPLKVEDSKHYEENLANNHTMIGIIDDIEIVFVHYDSLEEAIKKRNKRRSRVNFNNLLIKFNDQNLFHEKNLEDFNSLDYKNKVFFTGNSKYKKEENVVYFSDCKGDVLEDDIKSSTKFLNFKILLNEMKRGEDDE